MSASEPPPLPPPHRRPLFTLFSLPLSLTKRIRLTCLDLSATLLAVGTATGTVYYYQRPGVPAAFGVLAAQLGAAALLPLSSPFASRPCVLPPPTLLRLLTLGLPPASASLVRVSLCPHQPELLALTTASSLLVLHCPPHAPQQRERLLHRLDSPHITHLAWMLDDNRRPVLWAADNDGQLMRTVLNPSAGGGVGLGQRVSTEVICKLDSAIIQLTLPRPSPSSSTTSTPPFLLVSTLTRSYIVTIPAASSAAYQTTVIGSKPRKEAFTACIDPTTATPTATPHLLASRPGKRIWRADTHTGTVLSTLIIQPPPTVSTFAPVASCTGCELPATTSLGAGAGAGGGGGVGGVSGVQYSRLDVWCGGVVVWCVGCGWWLFVDVGNVCVVDWMVGLGRVMDVRCDGSECWLMHDREEEGGGGAAATAAALDDAVDISIMYSSSPYSHIQRLLSATSSPSSTPAPTASSASSLSPLIHFATKHRIYDRQLLTALQQRTQQNPLEPTLQQQFDALIVDAERAERLGRREDYWDDEAATPQHRTSEPQPSAATATAAGGSEVGSLAGVRNVLSSAAQLMGKLAQPQLGGKDRTKESGREKEKDAASTRPASPKPSFLERTSALFSHASSTVAPSHTTVTATASTAAAAASPAEQPAAASTNGTTKPHSTSRSSSPTPSLDPTAHTERPHSGKPSPINPFLLPSPSTLHPPKLTASSSFTNPTPATTPAATATTATIAPATTATTTATATNASDVFARASLLPADNLPFAEAVEAVGGVVGRDERKSGAEGVSAGGKRRRVVDVGAAGEEERREREKRRREKREAERKKREKEERDRQRLAQAAASTAQTASAAASDATAIHAAEKHILSHEVKEEPATASHTAHTSEEKQSDGTGVVDGDDALPSPEDSYPSPSDTEEEGGDGEAATEDDIFVEAEGDDVTVMLHPSSTSLFAGIPTSPVASLLPCLHSMRWTLTAATIACREADVSFTPITDEDAQRLGEQRWRYAQLPSLPVRRTTAAVDADSGKVQQSVWSAVSEWFSELHAALQQCDGQSTEAPAEHGVPQAHVESNSDHEQQRIHNFHQLLASQPPLLTQELTALLTLYFHLLLLSPHTAELSTFLRQHRSLLDRLTVYALLRHYRHPLCFALADVFPPAEGAERLAAGGLPADPIVLAAALPMVLLSPSAALAIHLAFHYPHIQPWMLIDLLELASALSPSALRTTSPIPLMAHLHSSLSAFSSSTAGDTLSDDAVHRNLNFYRAYLDHLLHSPTFPCSLKRNRSLTEPFLYLSLRLGLPTTPPNPSTTAAPAWPFSAALSAIAAQPSQYGFGAGELLDVLRLYGCGCGLVRLYVRLLLCAGVPSLALFEAAFVGVLRMDDVQSLAALLAVLSSSTLDLHTRLACAQSALALYVTQLEQPHEQQLTNVTLSHLLHPLLLALGPPLLLELLLSLPPTSPILSALPASFHAHLLAHSHALHSRTRHITAVVDTVDSYLWSERPAAVPPQLRKAAGAAGGAAGAAGLVGGRVVRVWAEDAGGVDWGRVVSGGGVSCGCCGVWIEWSERLSETVVCFACDGRHVYHRQCLPELACVLCLVTNMRARVSSSSEHGQHQQQHTGTA